MLSFKLKRDPVFIWILRLKLSDWVIFWDLYCPIFLLIICVEWWTHILLSFRLLDIEFLEWPVAIILATGTSCFLEVACMNHKVAFLYSFLQSTAWFIYMQILISGRFLFPVQYVFIWVLDNFYTRYISGKYLSVQTAELLMHTMASTIRSSY